VKLVHVAVAVIERMNGDICIAKRADHQHQGGLWEFPGGKVESDESVSQALAREILEELGIQVLEHEPLIAIRFRYPDKHVLLDVHKVTKFKGEPVGKEGQPVVWCPRLQLKNYEFPQANKGILSALLLPHYAAVVNGVSPQSSSYLQTNWMPSELLIYQRSSRSEHGDQLREAGYLVMEKGHKAFRHLSSLDLMEATERPDCQWLSASCHNEEEVEKANALGVDFIYISPLCPTPSHPEVDGIGWDCFQSLTELAHMPVYALGGVSISDLDRAKSYGAHGVAGIRAFQFN
jgi:8-oxo-dGTP diphosphatase